MMSNMDFEGFFDALEEAEKDTAYWKLRKENEQLQNDKALLEKVVEAAENYIKADAKKEMKVSLYYLNEALDLYKKAKHNSKGEDDE